VPRARAGLLVDVDRDVDSLRAVGSGALAEELRRPVERGTDLLGALVDLAKNAFVVPDALFVAPAGHWLSVSPLVAFLCPLRDALSGRISPC
jgi:hypothetical protein